MKTNGPEFPLTAVIKLGGSSVTDELGVRPEYVYALQSALQHVLATSFVRVAYVVGGGLRARVEQQHVQSNTEKDKVGIQVTQQHALQLLNILRELNVRVVNTVPANVKEAKKQLLNENRESVVLGGLEVGQSTDGVAITVAEEFARQGYRSLVALLSNVPYLFDRNPALDKNAIAIAYGDIQTLQREGVLPGKESFVPGMHIPIDPTALRRYFKIPQNMRPTIFFGLATKFRSIRAFFRGELPVMGTVLVPESTKTRRVLHKKRIGHR